MREDIKEFVEKCIVCQQTKYSTSKPTGLLQLLRTYLDFIIGLPNVGGFTVLLVVVDRFSKYVHLGALPSNFTTYKVAELFVNVHGMQTTTYKVAELFSTRIVKIGSGSSTG